MYLYLIDEACKYVERKLVFSSGSDISINTVIIPQNWGRNDNSIERYIHPKINA